MESMVEMEGELPLWMRMVSEGLPGEAHLSKTVKRGRENKVQRSWGGVSLGCLIRASGQSL